MTLLIRELHNQRYQTIALSIALNPRHVHHDRVAVFQRAQHALKIRQRIDRTAIDATDDVALDERGRAARLNAKLGHQSIRIDLFDVQSLNARQPAIREQLRRQFREGDAETEPITFRVDLRIWLRRLNPLAGLRPLTQRDLRGPALEFAVDVAEENER